MDAPLPYFKRDEDLIFKDNQDIDIAKWYREHNIFFDKLEIFFQRKLLLLLIQRSKDFKTLILKKD